MRISDWSSDVCSSDLGGDVLLGYSDRPSQMHERTKARRVMLGGLSISAEDLELLARYRDGAEERRDGSPNDVLIGHSLEERFVLVVVVRLMNRSEEHTSELQSLMRISYAVFCLKTTNSNDT